MAVYRRFSIATRDEVISGQINGAALSDDATFGQYAFNYDHVTGDYTDVRAGMTIDIGSTPGARDIGYTRVRKVPTSSVMYIAETAAGDLPLADNLYFTVRNEYLPWRRLPRGVGAQIDGATYTNDLTLYIDYDIEYVSQNDYFPPKPNITRAADSLLAPKPAGYLDTGELYRTITVSAAQSLSFADGIASVSWDIEDCTLPTGTLADETITIRVPEGFRYIHLTVVDNNGESSTMHYPLWAHGDSYAPLINFKVTSDETNEIGRNMNFEFFGTDYSVSETVLPRMALICYWEQEDLSKGETYRDQYLGWAKREATMLRLYRTRYTLETTGIAGNLDSQWGSSLYIYDPLETPDRWYEMRDMTIDKVAYFILHYFSTATTICNFYPPMNTYPTKGEIIEIGTVWRQLVEMVKGYYGVANADSLNSIWVRVNYCYLTQGERDSLGIAGTITRDKLTDESAITIKRELQNRISQVKGGGSSFDGENNVVYASVAPGRVRGGGTADEEAPGQRLPVSGSQTELDRVTGHHYAFVNNPYDDITLNLIGDEDIYEVAHQKPLLLDDSIDSVSGTTYLGNVIPRAISVSHSNAIGRQKSVALQCYGETSGNPGEWEVPPEDDVDIVIPPVDPGDGGGGGTPGLILGSGTYDLGFVDTNGYLYMADTRPTSPVWSRLNLTTLGMTGSDAIIYIIDAFNQDNGVLITSTSAYRMTNVSSVSRALGNAYPLRYTSYYRSLQSERGVSGFFAIASHDNTDTRSGSDVDVTLNAGVTWTRYQNLFGTFYTGDGDDLYPGCYVFAGTLGKILTSGYNGSPSSQSVLKVTSNYGANWADNDANARIGLVSDIHCPLEDESIIYHGGGTVSPSRAWGLWKTISGTATNIAAIVGGEAYGVSNQFGVKTCDVDKNSVIYVGRLSTGSDYWGMWLARDGAASSSSWIELKAPTSAWKIRSATFAGDSNDVSWRWGIDGEIDVCRNLGATTPTWRSLKGNLGSFTSPAVGRITNIFGV